MKKQITNRTRKRISKRRISKRIRNRTNKNKRRISKRTKRMRKQYGGDGGTLSIEPILFTIEELETKVNGDIDIDKKKYNKLYISIGGKCNEPGTNCLFQIIPTFLTMNKDDKVLVILVDNFRPEEVNDETQKISNYKRVRREILSDIDVVLLPLPINENETDPDPYFLEFFKKIFSLAKQIQTTHEIQQNRLMICSFMRFKNEGNLGRDETAILKSNNTIYNILSGEEYNYGDNFYLWCGYNPQIFYNMIFQYKNNNIVDSFCNFQLSPPSSRIRFGQLKKSDYELDLLYNINEHIDMNESVAASRTKRRTQIMNVFNYLISINTLDNNYNEGDFPPLSVTKTFPDDFTVY